MLELQGKYNTAKVFTDNAEQQAVAQIIANLGGTAEIAGAIKPLYNFKAAE